MKKKTIVVLLLLLAVLTLGFLAVGATVSLGWDGNCDTNVVGYTVYYGGPSSELPRTNIVQGYTNDCEVLVPTHTNVYFGAYTNLVTVSGRTNTTCTVSNLVPGYLYFFTVNSRSASQESDHSNEISYLVPTNAISSNLPTAVLNFRILKVEHQIAK